MNIIEKQAYFIDYKGNEQKILIRINDGVFIGIDAFNENDNPTSYIRMFFNSNKRLFLDAIYCYDEFRESGIATLISELADYVLSSYPSYVIRGVYEPGQLSTDRENKIVRNEQELDMAARKFYAKAGYEIVEYEEYLNNKDKYPYLIVDDFYLGEDGPTTIVTKKDYTKTPFFF